jgi:hypothetical protein
LRNTASVAARLNVGNEALAKILTSYNCDTGSPVVITEKKVRSQKTLAYQEAKATRMNLDVHGKLEYRSHFEKIERRFHY